jgi:Domain of unknown function (DUF4352)
MGQQPLGQPQGPPRGQQQLGDGAKDRQRPHRRDPGVGRSLLLVWGWSGCWCCWASWLRWLAGGDEGSETAADQASPTTARTREATKTTQAPAEEAAGMGSPVRDGKFEFVVSKVDCGKTRLGDTNFGKDAQGQFCTVNVKVTNIGREAQTLDASSQYLYGSGGQRFDADTEAALYLGVNQTRTFLEDINPGNSVNGILVFDIPKGEKPTKIELHDSPFSGGVTVEL